MSLNAPEALYVRSSDLRSPTSEVCYVRIYWLICSNREPRFSGTTRFVQTFASFAPLRFNFSFAALTFLASSRFSFSAPPTAQSETNTWLGFAKDCDYINVTDYERLSDKCESVGKMLGSMLRNPEAFLLRP